MFAQLDTKSAYSLLDGTMSVDNIVKVAKEFGYQAIAINDQDVMYGVMELKKAALKYNIKPIFSMRVTISHEEGAVTYLLLAKNNQGYLDLCELSTRLSNQKLSYEDLLKYVNDCIVIVHGEGGIIENEHIDTEAFLNLYKETLSDFYIGMSNNGSFKWKTDNELLKQLCQKKGVKTVALPKVEFYRAEDAEVKKLFQALKHNRACNDYSNVVNERNHFLSMDEIKEFYSEDDIKHTIEIAEKCNFDFSLLEKAQLPVFKQDMGVSSEDYLRSLCRAGLNKRFNNNVPNEYWERLSYELNVINTMGYADYFLIVYDFILFARRQDIYVGPGRGSSAGSLVAYVLGITHIDPLEYNLLFERFLNPERVSLPDIDIDFPDNRRDEVIEYVKEKYGSDHVAHIITFDTFGAKQAIRDTGRALGVPVYQLDAISKMIPSGPKITLKKAYESNVNLRVKINESNTLKQLYALAAKIEGLPRHTSMHAAGIVLADKKLTEYLPLLMDDKETLTQYSMNHLEELGLNKMDFLGLKNLTIIAEVSNQIAGFDIMNIPLNDKKTYQLISKADTSGIFQLESAGMRNLLKQMRPQNLEDIVATIALYRPGPMQNIPTFLKRRFNQEKVVYIHQDLKPILESTYGIIVYQEQIMQIAQLMANFSLAKADLLRKAMSDKDRKALHSLQSEFIEGSVKNGYTRKISEEVYLLIERFADYGFNKSHSVAYSLIAYQMAYLKANYPRQFYLSLLNSVKGSNNKTNEYINECRSRKIEVRLPSVNYSSYDYLIHNQQIMFPLLAIKGVGISAAKIIVEERETGGMYESFPNFVARVNLHGIKRDTLENLIDSGALDEFGLSRTTMQEGLHNVLTYANVMKVNVEVPYLDYDIIDEPKLIKYSDEKMEVLEKEYEVLGVYLSSHPIIQKKEMINYQGDTVLKLKQTKQTRQMLVQVRRIKEHRTKYGDLMAFISVFDETDSIDLVVMPDLYKANKESLKINTFVMVAGKSDRENSILVNKMKVI